jgi:hypothetical protein
MKDGQAEQNARAAMAEAAKLGFVRFRLEASLAIGEIQIQHGNQAAGRARLTKLQEDANAKGFSLLAKKASGAMEIQR